MFVTVLSVCLLCVACAHEHGHTHEHHGGQQQKHDSVPVVADAPGYIVNPDGPLTLSVSGQFRGSWMETKSGRRFQAYRGIRYAEPPIGALRFQPPKLKLKYEGEVDASVEGPACPQPAPRKVLVDEDCLTVNVYTPIQNSTGPFPVIFYIHHGGFYSMTGRSDMADPHDMLVNDVVFVAFNYRIGTLGFMSTGDAIAPGNNGMKDQVAALRWVQRNIAAFGGDPNQVTIGGCGSGSISVELHMISPMTKGLFHQGIAMSASPGGTDLQLMTHQRHLAVRQAEILNCPTDNSSIIFDCLMSKPWKDIGNSLTKFKEYGDSDPVGLWGPVLEPDFGQERYLTVNPVDAVKHNVPLITGQTIDDHGPVQTSCPNV